MKQPLALGFGFRFPDLYDALRLADLTKAFDAFLERRDRAAHEKLLAYRAASGKVPAKAVSDALVGAAPHVSAFVAELFGVETERDRMRDAVKREQAVIEFKREVVKRRVQKRKVDPSTSIDHVRPLFAA